jgi:hypothetical protein
MPNAKELVIFTQTYDLLTWLLPQCERFPKSQRFVVTQRLQDAALDFQEAIFEANARSSAQRLEYTTWKVSSFAGRQSLGLSGWHQYLQHFIAGFALGKIPLA